MTPSERTARLLLYLFRHGHVTSREAAELCDVDIRVARKDLKAISAVAPVRPVGQGTERRWMVVGELSLGILDRISLLVGREVTRFLEGTDLHRGFERLRELHGDHPAIPERIRYLAEPSRSYGPRAEFVDTCVDALVRSRRLAIVYEPPGGTDQTYAAFEPLTLVVYRRALYVVGRRGRYEYVLAIDRMTSVELREAFDYPSDWDPDAWLADRFGITAGREPAQDVVLEFSAQVAHLVRSRTWHATQRIYELPGGRVQLCMRARGYELARFVLEWGEHCKVVAPGDLRDRVIGELSRALDQYR